MCYKKTHVKCSHCGAIDQIKKEDVFIQGIKIGSVLICENCGGEVDPKQDIFEEEEKE